MDWNDLPACISASLVESTNIIIFKNRLETVNLQVATVRKLYPVTSIPLN